MDYTEVLRRLAFHDTRFTDECVSRARDRSFKLDAKTVSLVRIGVLVAVGGAVPSYGAEVDAALSAGATVDEIVQVLVELIPVVGPLSVVAAAPNLALALGYDVEDDLERQSVG